MSAIVNIVLVVILLLIMIGFLLFQLLRRKDIKNKMNRFKKGDGKEYDIPTLVNFVKSSFNEIANSNLFDLGLHPDEFLRRERKRDELITALKTCNTGNINDKLYVKVFINDLLLKTYGMDEDSVNIPIPFENSQKLSYQEKFDILLHLYKKKHGENALSFLIEKYNLAELKGEKGLESYRITKEEIDEIFLKEYNRKLSFEDKLEIITQRVYSIYKGHGVIDDIRDLNIDGVSGGVSGLPHKIQSMDDEMDAIGTLKNTPTNADSVWIMYRGKTIHLAFLSFGNAAELRRVTQTVYKHNNPGQLSESRPYIVNEMADGSRVVAIRPNLSESWAFFIRKFDIPKANLPSLIPSDDGGDMVRELIIYLMKGCRVTSITGAQGTGKTTLLMALINYINPAYNLRIQEMAFELNVRKIHPERNILTFQETSNVSGQAGLDLQKKTDGAVNILGEVATDEVAAWMIQMGQVASEFTVFSHHAKTFEFLIHSIRNSLLKTGTFSNEKIAEQQVVSVINFDIHLKKDTNGHRYVERVTECIPLLDDEDYPMNWDKAGSSDDQMKAFMETMTEYFRRQTDRKVFRSQNIIEYKDGRYVAVNPISNPQMKEMIERLSETDANEFKDFMNRYWREEQYVS
ncbi:ATPase, T2SS/T4P/T4SS family [Metabacillus fastidiosus]|uniref:ATPase, T2SS/T4P/T4SS family n=1 Tax=Metabacillus fastidiosus TaxID=1458 RepID=A0ABU6NT50_9BACI|nr:ATPase, T2SS/T4P/T4SS family [Metabacillus fastidiosus]MED4400328.1 ATPase, T2SS/T4P/T4SS family [Metabacillus fastidiosus]